MCAILFFCVSISLTACSVDVEKEMDNASKYLQDGKYEKAIKAYDNVLKNEPSNLDAKMGRAQALLSSNQVSDAIELYKEIVKDETLYSDGYVGLMDCYLSKNDFSGGLNCLSSIYSEQGVIMSNPTIYDTTLTEEDAYKFRTEISNKLVELFLGEMSTLNDIDSLNEISDDYWEIYLYLCSDDKEKFVKSSMENELRIYAKAADKGIDDGDWYVAQSNFDDYVYCLNRNEERATDAMIEERNNLAYKLYSKANQEVLEMLNGNSFYDNTYNPIDECIYELVDGYEVTEGNQRFVDDILSFMQLAEENRKTANDLGYLDMIELLQELMETASNDDLKERFIEYCDKMIDVYEAWNDTYNVEKLAKRAYEVTSLDKYLEYSDIEPDYKNTESKQNRWEATFGSVLDNLNGDYSNGYVERIYGTIENTMKQDWMNCRLTFQLYDEKDNKINCVSIVIGEVAKGEEAEFTTTSSDSLFMYKASKFQVIEIAPNSVY